MATMPIYDSHVHLKHGDAAATEYAPETIVETMDAAGIEKSVVFAMSTTTRRSIGMAQRAAQAFPGRLIPYVYALPNYLRPVLSEIDKAVSELGFRGIKLHAGECRLAGYVADPVFELAAELDVPCLVDFLGEFAAAERIASGFPGCKLIVAHLGQYLGTSAERLDRFIEIAEANENVFLDASGVALLWKIEDAVRRIGADRVLFGTDGPHEAPDTASFASMEVEKINMLDLSAAQKEEVLGGTLARLLKM